MDISQLDMSKLGALFEQAQGMKQQMDERLAEVTVEGSAGGGAVAITMSARKEVKRVTIAPSAASAAAGDITMLEDLVMAAFKDAVRKAAEVETAQANGMLGGMGLPGL